MPPVASSVVKKTGKKLAPKAPARRGQATAPPSARVSPERRRASRTPQSTVRKTSESATAPEDDVRSTTGLNTPPGSQRLASLTPQDTSVAAQRSTAEVTPESITQTPIPHSTKSATQHPPEPTAQITLQASDKAVTETIAGSNVGVEETGGGDTTKVAPRNSASRKITPTVQEATTAISPSHSEQRPAILPQDPKHHIESPNGQLRINAASPQPAEIVSKKTTTTTLGHKRTLDQHDEEGVNSTGSPAPKRRRAASNVDSAADTERNGDEEGQTDQQDREATAHSQADGDIGEDLTSAELSQSARTPTIDAHVPEQPVRSTRESPSSVSEESRKGPPKAARRNRVGKTNKQQQIEKNVAAVVEDAIGDVGTAPKGGRRKNPPKQKPSGEIAADSESNAVIKKRGGRKQREATPPEAENEEIVPTTMKMGDLCNNMRIGKKSKRSALLLDKDEKDKARKMGLVVDEPQQQGQEGAPEAQNREERQETAGEEVEGEVEEHLPLVSGPAFHIVNGKVQMIEGSQTVDRHAQATAQRSATNQNDIIEESDLTRIVNSGTYMKRTPLSSWDEINTELFYRGLRIFGTDFDMISKMFQGKTRRAIKLKFTREEREHPRKIRDALLGVREAVNLEEYTKMAAEAKVFEAKARDGSTEAQIEAARRFTFKDPADLQKELDEEERKNEELRAQTQEAQELLMMDHQANDEGGHDRGTNENEVTPSDAGAALEQFKADQKRKSKEAAKAKKKGKKGGYSGGDVEVLGDVDEAAVQAMRPPNRRR